MLEFLTKKHKALLSLIPLVFIVLNFCYLNVISPFYSGPPGYDQDPAYAYLFNGLLILDSQVPWHVDHPGTPLQFICAVVVIIIYSYFVITEGFQYSYLIETVLNNPETYLFSASIVVLLLNSVALYYFGYQVLKYSQKLWIAIFCQISGLSFAVLTPRTVYIAPEALLIFSSYCLLGLLSQFIFFDRQKSEKTTTKNIVLISITFGFGIAVKVTFIPMLGLIFLISDLSKIKKIIFFTFITFLALIIPAYTNLDRMFGWLWSVASHSGIHGSGHKIVMDWTQLITNMKSVLSWYLLLYCVMASLFIFLAITLSLRIEKIFKTKYKKNNFLSAELISLRSIFIDGISIRVPLVFLVVVAAQTLLVLKHPGAHYLIPVLPLAYVGLAWLFSQLIERSEFQKKLNNRKFKFVLVSFAAMFALYGTIPTIKQLFVMKEQRIEQNRALMVIKSEIEKYPNSLTICAFRCTTFQYAVSMGLLYAPGLASRPVVTSLLENFYEYNFLVKEMIAPGIGSFPLSEVPNQIKEYGKLLLITPKNYPELDVFKLKLVVSAGPLMLYEITGLSDALQPIQSRDQTN